MLFRKYLFALLLIFAITADTGCRKVLDINHDPNNPSTDIGNPKLVFPAATMNVAGAVGGDYALLGSIYAEYITQSAAANQYKFIDAYNVKSTDLSFGYTAMYAGGLKNLQYVRERAAAENDWNFFLMATVMKAYGASVLVDLYDQIPYSEALQGAGNLNPKFDEGYTVYQSLIAEINEALSKDFHAPTNSNLPKSGDGNVDLVFHGDMDKWKAFANTLELKLYLRMINVKPQEAESGVRGLFNRNASFLTTDAGVLDAFSDAPGLDNPLYEQNVRQLNTSTNLRASYTFVSFLHQHQDPRIVDYFGSASPNSIHQGDYLSNDNSALNAAVFVQKANDPVIFISAAESYLLQAEANLRYGLGAAAQQYYAAGVNAAFAAFNEDASSFIAPGGSYAFPVAGSFDAKLESIIVQKWASFPYGVHFIEGWFEHNRTGYPKNSAVYSTDASYVPGQFVVAKNSVLQAGLMPKRLVFPDAEQSRNSNAPAEVSITTPVWWGL